MAVPRLEATPVRGAGDRGVLRVRRRHGTLDCRALQRGGQLQGLDGTLFTDWKQWAELSGEYVGSQRRFSDALLAKRFEKWRNSMGVRGYLGLDLKQPTSMPAYSHPYNDD